VFNITDASSPNKTGAALLASALGAALLAAPSAAHADGACKDLVPAPIYGSGGSATKPLLGKVATLLLNASPPLTVVYQAPGACVGVNGLFGGTKITGTASYWDTAGKEQTCTLPDGGQEIDFANSGNAATSCPGVSAIPPGIADFLGPVNAFSLIVPKASSQTSISAEAAYFVFGFGQAGGVAPWVDEAQLYRRDANSAAQLFIALNTGVPAEKFKGIDTKTNSGTITGVAQSPKPEAALGLVSAELADANRATVRTLAFQAAGQRCGFWPDSTDTTFDKKSVRNGQYSIWAPLHFFAKVGADRRPVKPDVARFVGYFSGEVEPPPNVNLVEAEIKSGTVPKCAMNVWRETDIGAIRKYAPENPCHCYFDKVATGATSCTACSGNEQCGGAAPVCRFGFCEAR
jgi:ABC-type phosphate transport system substrate-binding protein